jgi:uncharacterized RDD family membrane protein YckC
VLASGVHACNFCESPEDPSAERPSSQLRGKPAHINLAHDAWRGELNRRLQAYRARRHKGPGSEGQTALPFEEGAPEIRSEVAVELREPVEERSAPQDDFAFTIAIGRIAHKEPDDAQVLIDVSNPPDAESACECSSSQERLPSIGGPLPVAPLYDRRRALFIDAACLAFAYGSFLALFGSLGGHFAVNKLSAAVCVSTFAFVYLQYFGLFTIFGGSTPGMMLSGLQVASITGDIPTPRQYLLRAAGYMLSAGTCFLGFFWVLWDEDGLTWHDRISRTYLANLENFAEEGTSHAAPVR